MISKRSLSTFLLIFSLCIHLSVQTVDPYAGLENVSIFSDHELPAVLGNYTLTKSLGEGIAGKVLQPR